VEPLTPKRRNPLAQGARFGTIGCSGCLTFVVGAIVFFFVLIAACSGAQH